MMKNFACPEYSQARCICPAADIFAFLFTIGRCKRTIETRLQAKYIVQKPEKRIDEFFGSRNTPNHNLYLTHSFLTCDYVFLQAGCSDKI